MLTFCEAKHEYKLNKVICPSVTQILQYAGIIDFSSVPQNFLEEAMMRGTIVHKICELADDDILDYDSANKIYLPYLDQWNKFKKDFSVELIHNEKRIISKKHFYAGTLDRAALVQGELAIIDIKTGVEQKAYALQTAAYEAAYKEMFGIKKRLKRYSVYLKPEQYKVVEYKNKMDFNIFLNALSICNFKRN